MQKITFFLSVAALLIAACGSKPTAEYQIVSGLEELVEVVSGSVIQNEAVAEAEDAPGTFTTYVIDYTFPVEADSIIHVDGLPDTLLFEFKGVRIKLPVDQDCVPEEIPSFSGPTVLIFVNQIFQTWQSAESYNDGSQSQPSPQDSL